MSLRAVSVLVLCASWMGVTRSAQAEVHVIAAGNNRGRSTDPALAFAERDAEQMSLVLRTLGRAEPENTAVLLGERAETLRRVLLKTNARLRSRNDPADQLIVYYSGHADGEGLHLGDSTMSLDEVKTFVESSPARVRVLILDACRSGGLTRAKGASAADPFVIRLEDRIEAEGLAIITSSAEGEDSQESALLRASFFTHHLLSALRGAADQNRDRRVSLAEAFAYAHEETRRSTGRTIALQHPTYRFDLRGSSDVTLTFLNDPSGRSGTVVVPRGAYQFFEGGEDGPIIAEVFADAPGGVLVLPPARYFVRRRGVDRYQDATFELTVNGRVELERLEVREVRYAELVRKGGDLASAHHVVLLGVVDTSALPGIGVAPGARITWGVDFSELSIDASARWSLRSGRSLDGGVSIALHEIAPGVRVQKYFDVLGMSAGVGTSAELVVYRQILTSSGDTPNRASIGGDFGVFAAVERSLTGPWVARLEIGPTIHVVKRTLSPRGIAIEDVIEARVTLSGALGVGWRY